MDYFHVFELGGTTLSKLLFDIKGEFYKGERIYGVKHLELYKRFREDSYSLPAFIKQMADTLHLFSDYNIVHCDLKPDNILIDLNTNPTDGRVFNMKVIDFGSAYNWDEAGNIGMATPEYMPPEFLQKLMGSKGNKSTIEQLADKSYPWSIDVWSLGAIILEIVTGVPLWMSLKCKIEVRGRAVTKQGLFAVKGRSYDKIYAKQKQIIERFRDFIAEYLEGWDEPELLYDLLSKMLRWDPARRISPADILQHPYVRYDR
jgi:Protein kinase domain.